MVIEGVFDLKAEAEAELEVVVVVGSRTGALDRRDARLHRNTQ